MVKFVSHSEDGSPGVLSADNIVKFDQTKLAWKLKYFEDKVYGRKKKY